MIPLDRLVLEDQSADDSEDSQRDNFLNDLELHEIERASVYVGAHSVGRDHE